MVNLILGDGQVGKTLTKFIPNNLVITKRDLDFSDSNLFKMQLKAILDSQKIGSIINAVAYTDVDGAEKESDLAMEVNANCPRILAENCHRHSIPLIHYSTDFVFDGKKSEPYLETDVTNPINHYGLTKKCGDDFILEKHDKILILRVSWVYSIFAKNNFVYKILSSAQEKSELRVVDDQIGSPCNAFDICKATFDILTSIPSWARIMGQKRRIIDISDDKIWGLYNLTPQNFTSRYEFANEIVQMGNLHTQNDIQCDILSCKTDNSQSLAQRPLNSRLDSTKIFNNLGIKMPNWNDSLKNAFLQYSKYK